MSDLVILGAGTAGTIMANKLRPELDAGQWTLTLVDQELEHYYQPGFLFVPFGIYRPEDTVRPRTDFLPSGVEYVQSLIERVDADAHTVHLANGRTLTYDQLIIATGTKLAPEETEGMAEAFAKPAAERRVHEFYTYEGSAALAKRLRAWDGGRLVVHITEMPIKCPVAPLEFAFLAGHWAEQEGKDLEITYVSPLDAAFTKPVAAATLGDLLAERDIRFVGEFNLSEVDDEAGVIRSWDEQEIEYDLLVTVPTNKGADFVGVSGLGDDLDFVPADKHTLRSVAHDDIWVIGDAGNFPTSKAGSVVHFQAETLTENLLRVIDGGEPRPSFDGHANCFVETGYGKALLIDFNYDTQPLPGTFPLPGIGPMQLLRPTRSNHWGKLMFRWVYWHLLLRGVELPIEPQMSLLGKELAA